jgi:hypothetical protein
MNLASPAHKSAMSAATMRRGGNQVGAEGKRYGVLRALNPPLRPDAAQRRSRRAGIRGEQGVRNVHFFAEERLWGISKGEGRTLIFSAFGAGGGPCLGLSRYGTGIFRDFIVHLPEL